MYKKDNKEEYQQRIVIQRKESNGWFRNGKPVFKIKLSLDVKN